MQIQCTKGDFSCFKFQVGLVMDGRNAVPGSCGVQSSKKEPSRDREGSEWL